MIIKIFVLCAMIHFINGQALQTPNGDQQQGYVFDLPPLQIQPLQIRVMPSLSTLYLIRENDNNKKMEFIPIEQYQPKDTVSYLPEANFNQIQPVTNNAVPNPVPQLIAEPPIQLPTTGSSLPLPATEAPVLPQTTAQAVPQIPKESSVAYDVPTVQSVLKDLSLYTPSQLPNQSLLYQLAAAQKSNQQQLVSQAELKNTRTLPGITLPAVTLQGEGLPIQTFAVELPPQTLPANSINRFTQAAPALPTQTLRTPTFTARPFSAQPFPAQAIKFVSNRGVQAIKLPLQPLVKPVPRSQSYFIQSYAEASPRAASPFLASPSAPAVPEVKPIPSSQKPITTEIRRRLTLPTTKSETLTSTPIETIQTLNQPMIFLLQSNEQIQPYNFGYQFIDGLGNQQLRKEEIGANGIALGNILDTNGAGIGTNEPFEVKANSKLLNKPTKKPIVLKANQPTATRKLFFAKRRA